MQSSNPFTAHEKPPVNDYTLRDLNQRLTRYKKRYARHYQITEANNRAGRPTNKRTLDALDNNLRWVQHYTGLIEKYKKGK